MRENIVMVCSECGKEIQYRGPQIHPGTSDMVLIPEPCSECFPDPQEQRYAIWAAEDTAAHDANIKALELLLEAAEKESEQLGAEVRALIRGISSLEEYLYLIEGGLNK